MTQNGPRYDTDPVTDGVTRCYEVLHKVIQDLGISEIPEMTTFRTSRIWDVLNRDLRKWLPPKMATSKNGTLDIPRCPKRCHVLCTQKYLFCVTPDIGPFWGHFRPLKWHQKEGLKSTPFEGPKSPRFGPRWGRVCSEVSAKQCDLTDWQCRGWPHVTPNGHHYHLIPCLIWYMLIPRITQLSGISVLSHSALVASISGANNDT